MNVGIEIDSLICTFINAQIKEKKVQILGKQVQMQKSKDQKKSWNPKFRERETK